MEDAIAHMSWKEFIEILSEANTFIGPRAERVHRTSQQLRQTTDVLSGLPALAKPVTNLPVQTFP